MEMVGEKTAMDQGLRTVTVGKTAMDQGLQTEMVEKRVTVRGWVTETVGKTGTDQRLAMETVEKMVLDQDFAGKPAGQTVVMQVMVRACQTFTSWRAKAGFTGVHKATVAGGREIGEEDSKQQGDQEQKVDSQ